MYKPTWQIYFNNTIAFILYLVLRLFFRRNTRASNKILFINTGQIGDLIVSSVIFTNQNLLTNGREVYFLVQDRYKELYKDYQGPITIIPWNYERYKYNPLYRISFLRTLHSIGFEICVNITAARGITNDEISLLCSARKVFCLNTNWKYLTKLFGRAMDSHYDRIYSFGTVNEMERNIKIIEEILKQNIEYRTTISIDNSTEKNVLQKLHNLVSFNDDCQIISMAPMTDDEIKDWPIENYKILCEWLLNNKKDIIIFLLGTTAQRSILESISSSDKSKIKNIAGLFSVLESAVVVKISDLFIGNDSGFTHIAKALQKKLIGVIGGGGYGLFFPYNETKNDRLLFHQLDCFGCEWRCSLDKPYCVHNVTVDQVFQSTLQLLKS